MSGPKTSHYTLTPEQRRILEEQRRVRMQLEMLEKNRGDTKSVIAEADRIIEQLEPLYTEIGADTTLLQQTKKLRELAVVALGKASSVNDKDGSARLQEINQGLQNTMRKLASTTKAVSADYVAADKAFRSGLANRIDSGFDLSFDEIGDNSSTANSPVAEKIKTDLESIRMLYLSDVQKTKVDAIQAKFEEIDDPDFLKSYYSMTVVPFVKECQAYHAAYAAFGQDYEYKLSVYEVNAKKCGIAMEHIPFSADAIAILNDRIQKTEEIIRNQDEQAYISRCVDEAMRELGYTVAGDREIVRRNGKRFRNELYLFDEGTAVNVTYSSDGQITMELGGIGTNDRLPTATESASLAADMRTFCDDYYEIERRLRQKGILTKRISILPPDEQYAQIINISDYNLSAEVSEYEAKGIRKSTAKAKTQRIGES